MNWIIDQYERTFGIHSSWRYKGGGQDPPSSQMVDTEMRRFARNKLYPYIVSGMEGRGFGPGELIRKREQSTFRAFDEAYDASKKHLDSSISRVVDRKDTRAADFMRSNLTRAYYAGKEQLKQNFRAEKVSDIDMSMGLAADQLAGEKRMAVSGAQMYNQALQKNIMNQMQYGSFASNLWGGIGEGMMDYYYAQKMAWEK